MSKLVRMPKNKMIEHIKKIGAMDKKELNKFMQEVSLSNADDKSKLYLNRAGDIRQAELEEICSINPMAVSSDIDDSWDK